MQPLLKNPTQYLHVKPTVQINPIWKVSDGGAGFRTRHERKFPEIDFCFQGSAHGTAGSSSTDSPNFHPKGGFHKLGCRYLTQETSRDFVADAIVFGMIVMVSAWPILSMIRALALRFH